MLLSLMIVGWLLVLILGWTSRFLLGKVRKLAEDYDRLSLSKAADERRIEGMKGYIEQLKQSLYEGLSKLPEGLESHEARFLDRD